MELTFCAPMNSRQKRSEHLIKEKKWYGEQSEVKRGMAHGRHYAKHPAYLHSREKVFDEMNDTYKNSLEAWDFDRVIAEDRAQMNAWHNEPHPRLKNKKTKEKMYPGMTRMEVLLFKQNSRCAQLNWRSICKEWGVERETSLKKGKSVTIDYREWWLSEAGVIAKFKPNNTNCTAYFIPEETAELPAGTVSLTTTQKEVREIFLYQDNRYIDKPFVMGKFQEAVVERTDKDIAIMNAQLGWLSHAKKVAKDHKAEVIIGKIGMMRSEIVERALAVEPEVAVGLPPPERAPEPDIGYRYGNFDEEEQEAMAVAML
jgi:hypothetical protein